MRHELKCTPPYFQAVWDDEKRFELRKDDRGFTVGDTLWLREWDGEYTGREIDVEVTYLLSGEPWLAPGFVALSISEIEKREPPSYAEQYGA